MANRLTILIILLVPIGLALGQSGEDMPGIQESSLPILLWDWPAQPPQQSILYWQLAGYRDGKISRNTKSWPAPIGGIVGTLFGVYYAGISKNIKSSQTPFLVIGISQSIVCLGGYGLVHRYQKRPAPPIGISKKAYNAYLRGYNRGVSSSNLTSVCVGSIAAALCTGVLFIVAFGIASHR